jgi:tricorn protease
MPARIFRYAVIAIIIGTVPAIAQEPIRFARTPDISPDGSLIAFSYLGNIWTVETIGGVARPVTMHEAHEYFPAFSPDGRWIAFSSNRHGDYDVYVVSVRGGKPRRLTYDSAGDYVCGWSPDGKYVLFMSTRSTDYPRVETLYKVPIDGGQETPLGVHEGKDVAISPKGDTLAYVRGPGLWYRKGYRGSSHDDIWLANLDGSNQRKVTSYNGQDSSPMWAPDGNRLYYVSEEFGHGANIVSTNLTPSAKGVSAGKPMQLTHHTDESVRRARISGNGEWIVYECGTDLWVASTKDGNSRKVPIEVYADDKTNPDKITTFTNGITEYAPSPDEKHFAFVVHGDVFMMPVAGGKATRVTDSSSYEHGLSWAPDGKKLLYISDVNGHENLYQLESDDPDHADLVSAIKFKSKQLTDLKEAILGPAYSPDGKKIAFLRSGRLCTMNADGAEMKVLVDDPQVIDYDWSPDSKMLVYARMDASFGTEIFITPAAFWRAENVTRYATSNYDVSWSKTGMNLGFISERPGPGGMQFRPYVLPLQKPAAPGAPSSTDIDWDDIHLRATPVASINAAAVSIAPDGARIAFRSVSSNSDDLWVAGSDGRQLNRLSSGNLRPQEIRWSQKHSGTIYFRDQNGVIRVARLGYSVFGSSGSTPPDPQAVNFSAKMTIRRDEEFHEMFEQSWRLLGDQFYDGKLHGADWNAVRARYLPAVKHIAHKQDLYALIYLMLGELNASHLGIMGNFSQPEEVTADLGLLFDETYNGPGKKIAEVLKRGPADKRGLNLKKGEVVLAIDRTPITEKTNLSQLLNAKVGENVLLEVLPANGDMKDPKIRRKIEIQAIGRPDAQKLMYERWVDHNATRVKELSGGTVGYIHIPSMDQDGLDRFVRALYSDCFDKDAIVLDVRYNGGGYTHDKVLNFLTGREHTVFKPRAGGEGLVLRADDRKWTKPLVLLINNQSYSDAEIFPNAFRELGLGKLVGQPTGGMVIGTHPVRLIDGSTFRIPAIGVFSMKGINMEKEGVAPDYTVVPSPEDLAKGVDLQLDKAVEVVKGDVLAWKQSRTKTIAGGPVDAKSTATTPAPKPMMPPVGP